jgi:uncharacterized membrane protein
MFEVILTYRDFSEHVVDRYPTAEEAQAVAERVSELRHDKVIRVWVKQIRQVRTK